MPRLLLVLMLALAGCGAGSAAQPAPSLVQRWSQQTAQAVSELGPVPDPVRSRTWALAWWAADRAVRGHSDGAFADTAVATAVHDVLVDLVPTRRFQLDTALTDSRVKDAAGRQAGAREAAAVLAERRGDGLTPNQINRPYVPKSAAVGVWRPTPPDFTGGQQAGEGDARPFLLQRTGQLRPGPPAPPGSAAYERDLAELRTVGEVHSTTRTAAQTATAKLWENSPVPLFTDVLDSVLAAQPGTVRSAHLLSVFHRVTLDAQLADYEAKYAYVRWRPVTAIQVDGDGDPATPQVPGWLPLVPTPPQPEYPSGHTSYTGAATGVLAALVDAQPPGTVRAGGRDYDSWQQVDQDVEDSRVWGGIHFRGSDQVGTRLGHAVAAYDLAHLG